MMELEAFYTAVLYCMTALFGLCIGSFLNVVIYRVPENMSIAMPPSHCPKCGYQLKPYDNIPVLSYLILGGKCRKCRESISPRYMIVELTNALLWILSLVCFGEESLLYAFLAAAALSVSICIFFIDLETMLIFDRFQIILAVLGVAASFCDPYEKPLSHLIGALAAGGSFLLLAIIAKKILGRDALGGGDIKLAAGIGLFLGWRRALLTVLLASLTASIVLLLAARRNGDEKGKEYPFGPFLTAGFAFAIFLGEPIITWYLSLIL